MLRTLTMAVPFALICGCFQNHVPGSVESGEPGFAGDMAPLDMVAVHASAEREALGRAESPSLRRSFLKGYFETRNRSFPVDVEQAIAGRPTDHPVYVWAGNDVARKKTD